MTPKGSHTQKDIEARNLRVRFSPAVQDALRSIVVAAQHSSNFDPDICEIIKNWSSDKPTTVHDFIIAFPTIAGEVMEHLSATRDAAMKQAWDDLCVQLPESGFKVSQSVQNRR
jgi:hypothetical protein